MKFARKTYKLQHPKSKLPLVRTTINLVSLDGDFDMITPYSEFTLQFKNKKPATAITYANLLSQFLNFVFFEQKYFMNSPTDFTLEMGVDFINNCNLNLDSKRRYARQLSNFYYFLFQKGLLNVFTEEDFLMDFDSSSVSNIFAGYYDTSFSSPKVNLIHEILPEFLPAFFRTVKDVAPEILLGVYFQMFGGLRMSEVISITYSDIRWVLCGDEVVSMSINLEDRDLRPDLNSSFLNRVKKNRKQLILPNDELMDAYLNHCLNYKSKKTEALFVNRDGLAMTAKSYQAIFGRVKAEFIKRLSESDNLNAKAYAVTLSTHRWASHIGRGTFSNHCAEYLDMNGLAAIRGDSSMESARPYLSDTSKLIRQLKDVGNEIYYGKEISNEKRTK